jgi:hypothetical protein
MPSILFYAEIVISRTPVWVWLVLALLCLLGVRRLRTHGTSPWGLVITPAVFLTWSFIGAVSFGDALGLWAALACWAACIAVGLLSFALVGPPRSEWVDEHRIVRPGSIGPLSVYLAIFGLRYGLEIWAGFFPERATLAAALALILSGFMAGRTTGDLGLALRKRPLFRTGD